jgi:hypothetical protein
MCTVFWLGNLKGRDHLEDLSVDGKIILGWILGKSVGSVEWMHLALDVDRWRALVKVVTKLGDWYQTIIIRIKMYKAKKKLRNVRRNRELSYWLFVARARRSG